MACLLLSAAGAYAFDLGGLFTGCGEPAALGDLAAAEAPPAPAPAAEPKPGDCDFPLNIKPDQVRNYISFRHPVVLDIRTPQEHAAGYIVPTDGLMDFRAPDFKDQLDKLDRNGKYLIYCRSGHRSGLALAMMKDMGFTEYHDIEGGINAWIAAGLPVAQ